jgi:hypothetical protein
MSSIFNDVECIAHMRVSDASEIVTISRDLTLDDNSPGASDEWDPMLDVTLYPPVSELHPDDPKPGFGEIEHIRASELRKLVECLNATLTQAEMTKVIPPPLADEEWKRRRIEAKATRGA